MMISTMLRFIIKKDFKYIKKNRYYIRKLSTLFIAVFIINYLFSLLIFLIYIPCRVQHIISLKKNEEKLMPLENARTEPWELMNSVNNDTKKMLILTAASYQESSVSLMTSL